MSHHLLVTAPRLALGLVPTTGAPSSGTEPTGTATAAQEPSAAVDPLVGECAMTTPEGGHRW